MNLPPIMKEVILSSKWETKTFSSTVFIPYHFTYQVKDAFIFAKDHTEFYWNILGNEWPVEVKKY
ncbi:MAG: DUF2207 domain-containing protein [Saprospiraceae bacterium]|nr:DUF2207 domain-containing protein [Saprospiraceae bacterium]